VADANRQEWGTDHFEVGVAVSGMDVSFDLAQVILTTEDGQRYKANSIPDKRRPDQAWILGMIPLVFRKQCTI
jgi:hypothetical protein